ncbi:hypothetical protein MNBD_GAMMA09-345 [hydrothermal vent metagenome]|uniref:Helix-hairpin-helix DNA-binding motif class 1 domain-containing protein n=1 Tax=hydrothermal vent metagenome TaxID=652676 RepID=A0A3B0XT01_9ZZZZ
MKLLKVVSLSVMMLCATGVFFSGQVFADEVNINRADAMTLETELKGIGRKKAEAIIEYREQNGPFTSVDSLQEVKGISEKTIEKNRANITL